MRSPPALLVASAALALCLSGHAASAGLCVSKEPLLASLGDGAVQFTAKAETGKEPITVYVYADTKGNWLAYYLIADDMLACPLMGGSGWSDKRGLPADLVYPGR